MRQKRGKEVSRCKEARKDMEEKQEWKTVRRILMAWVFTLPCTMLLSGGLFALGRYLVK